ncbi:MAG: hypothetical protein ACREF4_04005 [Gammaproteobacteria bacterium]
MIRFVSFVCAVLVLLAVPLAAGAAPEGQMTWAVHTTLVPVWFDPGEALHGTPFMVLSALHDAVVKPMPGKNMAPSLAESWTVSPDGLVYEFVLRKGMRFHKAPAWKSPAWGSSPATASPRRTRT